MLTSGAYVAGTVLIFTVTLFLYRFNKYMSQRYREAACGMPLEIAAAAPKVKVDATLYMPPALR
jgi:hypothetical protein